MLMYRTKRTDLGHSHYICMTNMSIRYAHMYKAYYIRTMGPCIWKLLCCSEAGLDMPVFAAEKTLAEHKDWDKQRQKRCGDEFYEKRSYRLMYMIL